MSLGPGRVVMLGGGAVGSFVGGSLAAEGIDVVLIDGWPAHVETIRAQGLALESPEGAPRVHLDAWHLGEAHRLREHPCAVAFITVKLYDTDWAAHLLAQWLPPGTPVVSLQNALVEERVARVVGWSRTLGAIAGGLDVALAGAGIVRRTRRRRSTDSAVFKVGELHGRVTGRASGIAALLDRADRAEVTTDLWNERWTKLCANTMTTGISGVSGFGLAEVYGREDTGRVAAILGAEALAVGAASGFRVVKLFGCPPEVWIAAGRGDADALAQALSALRAQAATMVDGGRSGTLQDLLKRRPTEVEFLNGYIAREASRVGVQAPAQAIVADMIREVERGSRAIDAAALAEITRRVDAARAANR